MNTALLAKQVWRLHKDSNSLLAKIFKAKYYKQGSLLEAPIGPRPSFIWRSIKGAADGIKDWVSFSQTGTPLWSGEGDMFSVKAVYASLNARKAKEQADIVGECSDDRMKKRFWSKVWRIKVQGKVKVFIWRLFHNFLPTALNLRRRGCDVSLNCCICGFRKEDAVHLFLECWWASTLWNLLLDRPEFLNLRFTDIGEWISYCVSKFSQTQLALIFYATRLIWFNRNNIFHGKKSLDVRAAAITTRAKVEQVLNPTFRFSISIEDGPCSWQSPSGNAIKINCDGSWFAGDHRSGFGCIARDSNGLVHGVLAGCGSDVKGSFDVEMYAILKGMEWALCGEWQFCCFEIDCVDVFNAIYKEGASSINTRCRRCAELLATKRGWSLSLVRREGNTIADSLARKAGRDGWIWEDQMAIPKWVGSLVV